jgi:pyridoxamine 5'-phosphate oxidase family protein
MFTEKEIAYIKSQPLARLATVGKDDQPDNVAVGFEFDDPIFYVGGRFMQSSRKYKNVSHGHSKVALIIDDLASRDPWQPRGIRIFGEAEIVERDGRLGKGPYFKIVPTISWSWQIEGPTFIEGKFLPRRTVHK